MHFYSRHQSTCKFFSLERRQWPCLLFVHMTQRKTNLGLANVSIHGTSYLNQQRNSSSGLSQVSTTQVSRKLHQVSETQGSYPQRLKSSSFFNFPPRCVCYRWGYRGTLEHQQSGHATLNFPPPSSFPNKCTLSTIKRQLRHKRHPWSGWTVVLPEGQSLTQYDLSHLIGPSSWS